MKKVLRLTLSLLCLTAFTSGYAFQFSNVYSFGDSLSDIGNTAPYSPNAGSAPWTNGHGDMWTKILAGRFGIDQQPSTSGGTNYARFADQTGNGSPSTNCPSEPAGKCGVVGQVDQLLSDSSKLDSKALYTIWAGANNIDQQITLPDLIPVLNACSGGFNTLACQTEIQQFNATTGQPIFNNAAADITNVVGQLHNAGAKYLLVVNTPDMGNLPLLNDSRIPFYPLHKDILSPLLTGAAAAYNQQLSQQLNALPFDVIQIDIFSIMNYVLANGSRFGFVNVNDALCNLTALGECPDVNDLNPAVDPDTYLFFDSIHPTAAGHRLIADYIYATLQGPTYYALLAQAPFGSFKAQSSNIFNQLQMLGIEGAVPEKTWQIFAAGNYASQNTNAIGDNKLPGYKTDNKNVTVGAYYRHNANLTYGAAFGPSIGNISADNYSADVSELFFSLFGEYKHELSRAYINSVLSFGIPKYNNIKRKITLGPAISVSNAAVTRGRHFGGVVNAGLNAINNERFNFGPTLSLEYQNVNISGYNESGLFPGSNLNYFKQSNSSLTSGLGLQASFLPKIETTQYSINGFAQFNTQYLGGDKDIRFETASLPGSHGAVPTTTPKGSYVTLGANIAAFFKNKVGLTLGAKTLLGNSDFAQQIYTITASIPF